MGLYPQIWSRFKNHFRIARYSQLSQTRLSEAVEYLTKMDLTEKALPPSPSEVTNNSQLMMHVPVEAEKSLKLLHSTRERCRWTAIPNAYPMSDKQAAQRAHLGNSLYLLQDALWAALYNVTAAVERVRTWS